MISIKRADWSTWMHAVCAEALCGSCRREKQASGNSRCAREGMLQNCINGSTCALCELRSCENGERNGIHFGIDLVRIRMPEAFGNVVVYEHCSLGLPKCHRCCCRVAAPSFTTASNIIDCSRPLAAAVKHGFTADHFSHALVDIPITPSSQRYTC